MCFCCRTYIVRYLILLFSPIIHWHKNGGGGGEREREGETERERERGPGGGNDWEKLGRERHLITQLG